MMDLMQLIEIFDKVDNIYADGKISIGSIYQPKRIATSL